MVQLLCNTHQKMRSAMCLEEAGGGIFQCRAGTECKGGGIKRTLCKFFQMGTCTKGEQCTFSHDPDAPAAAAEDPWGKGGGKSLWGSDGYGGKGGGKDFGMDKGGGKGGGMAKGWGKGGGMDMGWGMPDMAWMKGMMGMDMGWGKGGGKSGGKGKGGDWVHAPVEEKFMCSVHNKPRSVINLQDNGNGTFSCIEGGECHGFGHGGVKRAICKFFQHGQCTRGEACAYAHDESEIGSAIIVDPFAVAEVAASAPAPSPRKGVAPWEGGKGGAQVQKGAMSFGLSALCSAHNKMRSASNLQDNGDGTASCMPGQECRDAGEGGGKRIPCKFHGMGTCTKGQGCAFSHDVGMGGGYAAPPWAGGGGCGGGYGKGCGGYDGGKGYGKAGGKNRFAPY